MLEFQESSSELGTPRYFTEGTDSRTVHDQICIWSAWAIDFGSCNDCSGWLGRAMVLGSFQCRCVLLLWHMVGQGPTVLAAGARWVGCFFVCVLFFISSILSFLL